MQAQAYIHQSDFRKSIEIFEKLLVLDPSLVEIHLRLAVLYDDYLVQDEKALVHYKQYLTAVPNSQLHSLIQGWMKNIDEKSLGDLDYKHGILSVEDSQLSDIKEKYQEMKTRAEKLDKLVLDQEKQLGQIGQLKQEIVALKARRRELAKQVEYQKAKSVSLEKKLEEKMQLLQEYERRLDIFGTSYEEGVNRMEVELKEYRKKSKDLTHELSGKEKQLHQAERRINQLIAKGVTLERALEKSQEDMQYKNIEMAQQIVTQRDRIKKHEDASYLLSEKMKQSASENKRYESALRDYKTSIQSKVSQINQLRKDIKKLKVRNQQLLARLTTQSKDVDTDASSVRTTDSVTKQKTTQTYRVKKGETLRTIAGYHFIYGDREKWRLIYNANRDKIPNPNHLVPGQILDIPRD